MFTPRFVYTAGPCLAFFIGLTALAGPVPTGKPSHYPAWWFERDVIPLLPAHASNSNPVWPTHYPVADDYAVANIGQLKSIAAKAAGEMNSALPSPGAGDAVNNLVSAWAAAPTLGVVRDDFSALNQGQLKSVAKLFYDRLDSLGYTGQPLTFLAVYPWTTASTDDESYSLVNLGQLKLAFSFLATPFFFDAYLADSDGDGIPDGWESEHDLNPNNPDDAELIVGGITNLARYQQSLPLGNDPSRANSVGLMVYSP